ncbi:DinB family protein [Bacillus sp. EB600]|uniref:DinB family protein n=1 Tax=Bacillus sp. EB600 TaxID=2806345 RepID=UPI00210D8943|nr:DinB family protein [Bacillus sp. EB600]MCQ6282257.1 DinB family protein [Bacillus sp. EB600]
MSEIIFKQYNLTRDRFIKRVQNINPEIVDIQPKGFNNNIHWMVGHVLTVAEQFLFSFPANSANLPASYKELFGSGTKPDDWTSDVPSVAVLVDQLTEQLNRINQIPASQLAEKLEKPFLGCETFGELAGFGVYHEALHLGQIQTFVRLIEA